MASKIVRKFAHLLSRTGWLVGGAVLLRTLTCYNPWGKFTVPWPREHWHVRNETGTGRQGTRRGRGVGDRLWQYPTNACFEGLFVPREWW